MPTLQAMAKKRGCRADMGHLTAEPPDLPTVWYPEEVIERLKRESEDVKRQLAAGEIRPMTASELAAMYGMTING